MKNTVLMVVLISLPFFSFALWSRHKLIKPFTPRHNGKVERSHRKDNERFYATHTFYSFEDFSNQLRRYNRNDYNNFPMRPLGWKTPLQTLRDYLASV